MTKRKGKQPNDSRKFKRFKSGKKSSAKSKGGAPQMPQELTRKQKRKEARLEKKSRNNAYHRHWRIPTKEETENALKESQEKLEKEEKLKKIQAQKQRKQSKKERKERMEKEQIAERRRIEELYYDKEIKDLEKKLKLNKRKKKDTLPMSFIADGLDYILDAVDSDKLKEMAEIQDPEDMDDLMSEDDGGNNFDDEGSDGDDDEEDDDIDDLMNSDDSNDLDDSSNKKAPSVKKMKGDGESISGEKPKWEILADKLKKLADKKNLSKKKVTFAEDTKAGDSDDDDNFDDDDDLSDDDNDSYQDDDDDEDDDDGGEGDDDYEEEDDGNESDTMNEDNKESGFSKVKMNLVDSETGNPDLKEDIYGRLRDTKGNVVVDNKAVGEGGAYVPPARRLQMMSGEDGKKKLQMERLLKQMKGLVNRASENNIQPISSQIEDLYLQNSRADVNNTLVGLISDACISTVLTPERLTMELMMLVAILHGNIGSEVGASFLEDLARRFGLLLKQKEYGAGKQMDNVVVLIAHLYNFKVVHSGLIFDILKKLTESFTEKDIELILLLLRHVGFSLRKDNPVELKEYIVKVQSRATDSDAANLADQSRVRFMLDVIMAIRNNNMRKIPNYDPEHLDHLRKLIRNYIRGGKFGDNQLNISLEDLWNADIKGKWWVVGSAWEGKSQQSRLGTASSNSVLGQLKISNKLQELARKQRMNTDLRRNIFFVIMTSEDYMDAFEKLLRLGLKSNQQQEILLVIIDCCLQEKQYNPFYSHLGQKFCEHHRTYQMGFQFCIWDRFKEVKTLTDTNRHHLAKLLVHLITTKALSLSIFKVISFGTLEKAMVRLLKQLFTDLLLEQSLADVEAAFTRVAKIDKLKIMHEGLRLFLRHFLLGKNVKSKPEQLVERVDAVERILSRGRSQVLL
ncbi:Nucleolar MIF4G domain-containing protein 1 [Mactra antiquata]